MDRIEEEGGKKRIKDSTAYSCSVEPGGGCVFVWPEQAGTANQPPAGAAPACADPLHPSLTLSAPEAGTLTVSDYTARDTERESWVSASFTLQDADKRLTEEQARSTLDHLAERIASVCRSYRPQKTRIFLYPAGVIAGESANWIARLDDDGTRSVELHRNLLKDTRSDPYACLNEKEPGIGGNEGTRLPPVRQREIIGTWADVYPNLSMSLERVKGKVYKVYRTPYCESGSHGQLLHTRSQGRYAVIDSRAGDYYQVLPSGDLGVFDRDGRIDVLPRLSALYPAAPDR